MVDVFVHKHTCLFLVVMMATVIAILMKKMKTLQKMDHQVHLCDNKNMRGTIFCRKPMGYVLH